MELQAYRDILSQFAINGTVAELKPLGAGLINDTFKAATTEADQPDYVLQRINHNIFQNVEVLMHNIASVTQHIRTKLEAQGVDQLDKRVLTFVPLKEGGKYFYFDGTSYWRVMVFIPGCITKTEVNAETSFDAGVAFGQFQAMLADIPVELGDTIPNFHNMEFRLQQLRDAVKENKVGRVAEVQDLIDELEARAELMCQGERWHREGKLPKRICHCDTKVDNMLFDQNDKVLCVIDLDTVMPNFIFSDLGDFLRSAANTGKEDDQNLDNISFNIEIFKAFTKGYLQSARGFLLPIEIENLPYATALFPYMQTVRFLADYINGDTYYKIQYPEHNLVRSRAQFKLLQSVEAHTEAMKAFIQTCL